MAIARRQGGLNQNYWPGFVDALAAFLMVSVFLVMVFALAQFSFSELLSQSEGQVSTLEGRLSGLRRDANAAREAAALSQAELAEALASLGLTTQQLTEERIASETARGRADGLALRLTAAEERVAATVESLSARGARILELVASVEALEGALGESSENVSRLGAQNITLEEQLARLTEELSAISASLAETEVRSGAQAIEIEDLTGQLSLALAREVEELERYRSEFFGRLRDLLGEQDGIQIVGDRFVLQSEILFPSSQASLTQRGQLELTQLATTLREITAEIPSDIDWILRVGGHTDIQPIATAQYPSNWELSMSRALDVVKFLIAEGLPPERLIAAGFGEYQPLDDGISEEAFARNRRIEFKLTER